jgi:hypothetical protein
MTHRPYHLRGTLTSAQPTSAAPSDDGSFGHRKGDSLFQDDAMSSEPGEEEEVEQEMGK